MKQKTRTKSEGIQSNNKKSELFAASLQPYRNTLQVSVSLFKVVNQPSWSCNHNFYTRTKIPELTRLWNTTVNAAVIKTHELKVSARTSVT